MYGAITSGGKSVLFGTLVNCTAVTKNPSQVPVAFTRNSSSDHAAKSFHEKAGSCQDGFSSFLPRVCSHSAEPPLSPSFHPHSFVSDIRSVPCRCPSSTRPGSVPVSSHSSLSGSFVTIRWSGLTFWLQWEPNITPRIYHGSPQALDSCPLLLTQRRNR